MKCTQRSVGKQVADIVRRFTLIAQEEAMDTSKIEGYAEMTLEQKVAALEGYAPEAPDLTGYVRKELLDKAASEAAGYKKQLKEKMTAEEAAEADRQAAQQALQDKYAELEARYAELERQSLVSGYKAKLTAMGYDEAEAEATAKAMAEGDTATVLANQEKFLAKREKELRADALKGMSGPESGGNGGAHPEDEDVRLARRLGQEKAKTGSGSADILKHYTL